MQPETLSVLGMYGDRLFFQACFTEGFTEVSFGRGGWLDNMRIVAIFAFYHSDGRIKTLVHHKCLDPMSDMTARGGQETASHPNSTFFERFCGHRGIVMTNKFLLPELLRAWEA